MKADVKLRRSWLALAAIVLVAVVLRVWYSVGFMPTDDAEYARVAYQISHSAFSLSRYPGPPVVPVRSGIVLPTALVFRIFGPSEWAMAAYPLLLSVTLLLLVFALTAKMFDTAAGLVAAGLWALIPYDRLMATSLRPDLPSTTFAILGLFLIFITRARRDTRAKRALAGGLGAGLAFGIGWLCKESVVYFVPFCLLLAGWDLVKDWRGRAPLWAGVAIGSVAVLGGEMWFYAAHVGDPLYRLHATEADYVKYPELFFARGSRFGFDESTGYWKALGKRLLVGGPSIIFLNPDFLYLPVFGAIATLYGAYWRDRRFAFVAGLFVSLVLMFNFGSVSLHGYQPLPLFPRYFYPIALPAAVLTGGLLSASLRSIRHPSDSERQEAQFWGGLVALLLISICASQTFRLVRDATPTWSSAERSLANVLGPRDRIYTDPLSINGLEFFWHYPARMNVQDVSGVPDSVTFPCNSFLLVNASYVDWLRLNHGTWLTLDGFHPPASFRRPPPDWQKVWTNQNADLYRVGCRTLPMRASASTQ